MRCFPLVVRMTIPLCLSMGWRKWAVSAFAYRSWASLALLPVPNSPSASSKKRIAPLASALSNTAFRFCSVSPMYWLTTADKSTLNKSTISVSANVSAAFLRRSAVEPDRTRTAADVTLDFFVRRTDVAFFCSAARVPCPLMTLSDMSTPRSLQCVEPEQHAKKVRQRHRRWRVKLENRLVALVCLVCLVYLVEPD